MSEYSSVIFCWAVGGVCFLRKTESYICLEVTTEIVTEPQFSLMYGVQGMGLISFLQTEGLIIVSQSDGREWMTPIIKKRCSGRSAHKDLRARKGCYPL